MLNHPNYFCIFFLSGYIYIKNHVYFLFFPHLLSPSDWPMNTHMYISARLGRVFQVQKDS